MLPFKPQLVTSQGNLSGSRCGKSIDRVPQTVLTSIAILAATPENVGKMIEITRIPPLARINDRMQLQRLYIRIVAFDNDHSASGEDAAKLLNLPVRPADRDRVGLISVAQSYSHLCRLLTEASIC